ncbi:MAG: M20/M25/M40 family metallo-hydrolase [Gemmatimonadaceae bacterium]
MILSPRAKRGACSALLLAVALPVSAAAQDALPTPRTLAQWIDLDIQPGDEHGGTAVIRRADPRWNEDAQGNLVLAVGTGHPRRVIACALDHTAYVVSQVTDDGYLRIHRGGAQPVHPLWDQFHQGQQVVVRTARGLVPGVVAIPNGHFARQHRGDTTVVNVDQLWVDVGTRTRAETEALGIALIDPVRRDVPAWGYGSYVAGADASGRAACAAVAAVAHADTMPSTGETTYILGSLRSFANLGTSGALARLGDVDEVTMVSAAARGAAGSSAVTRHRARWPFAQANVARLDSVTTLAVRARWVGSLVESVTAADAEALRASLASTLGVTTDTWMPIDTASTTRVIPRTDALEPLAGMLRRFADLPGVPGHEVRVRDAVIDAMPEWARKRSEVDSAGNVFFAVGPARDTVVVMAHLDEVSYVVSGIGRDGTVTLEGRGGVINSAWEGQPALLHFDGEEASLPGVFVPRDSASVRTPARMTAWFGTDSAGLVGRGVTIGSGVTAYKRGERIGATRFTGRALDDRAGSVALLRSLIGLEQSKLDHTIIFAWTTREEGGLLGAQALASQFGTTAKRVYAVDTFVSSDTPLEQHTFAYVPLGAGPVLRALDDGLITPRAERERVMRIAKAALIPLQVGTTHGSTDATTFARYGAVTAGLSWPGRYSHTPGEVLDLRDVDALARLIRAVVSAPAR